MTVLGLFDSGKTVLTTALINHLRYHNPREFKLGGIELTFIARDNVPAWLGKASEFPYERYRARVVEKWPQKTVSTTGYACRFLRSDLGSRECSLLIIDIPGERFGDLAMADRTFAKWSDWILELFESGDYAEDSAAYRSLLRSDPAPSANAILDSYREALARLVKNYRPVISPSTFLVSIGKDEGEGEGGRKLSREIRNGDLRECILGISEDKQFAPLPNAFLASHPDLYKAFEKHYTAYKQKLVMPLRTTIRRSRHLVILADITGLLAANTARKNGDVTILREVLDAVRPGCKFWNRVKHHTLSYVLGGRLNGSGIRKITAIATKADKVPKKSHSLMKQLLTDMMRNDLNLHRLRSGGGLDVEYLTVSAMQATATCEYDPNMKVGIPKGKDQDHRFAPTEMPKEWPEEWREADFNFPDVEPRFAADITRAPKHIDLNEVMKRVLDIS